MDKDNSDPYDYVNFLEEEEDKNKIEINMNNNIYNNYKEIDNHDHEAHNEEKNTLISMGFDEKLINKVYKNIKPNSLQEAIDYISKNNNDKFIHTYIPSYRNVCLICEEKREAHAGEKYEGDFITPTSTNSRIYRDSLEKYREKKEKKVEDFLIYIELNVKYVMRK